MEDFQIKYFAKRLKIIAKSEFGGVGKLAEALKISQGQLSNYTKLKGTREPGISFAYRLIKLDIDINWILTGKHYVDKDIEEKLASRLKEFETEIIHLKARMFDYEQKNNELISENKRLKDEKIELTETIENLSVQYSRVAEVNVKYEKRKLK